jgi:Domain of unknown function (DUF1990)
MVLAPSPQVGYGRHTYESTKRLLTRWGQFQLPWACVHEATPTAPGTPVCVSAQVFGVWTAVPLQVVCVHTWRKAGRCGAVGRDCRAAGSQCNAPPGCSDACVRACTRAPSPIAHATQRLLLLMLLRLWPAHMYPRI